MTRWLQSPGLFYFQPWCPLCFWEDTTNQNDWSHLETLLRVRETEVPGGFDSSGKYHLTYNNLEYLWQISFYDIPHLNTINICLFVYVGIGSWNSSEEAVAALIEWELAAHNKPNLCVSINCKIMIFITMITFSWISNTWLYITTYEQLQISLLFGKFKMAPGNQFWWESRLLAGWPIGWLCLFLQSGWHYFQMPRWLNSSGQLLYSCLYFTTNLTLTTCITLVKYLIISLKYIIIYNNI